MFTFIINVLEMVFNYLSVTRATYYYIIIVARTALNSFTVGNAKGSIIRAKRYFIIKKTLVMFGKKFTTTSNKRKYLEK